MADEIIAKLLYDNPAAATILYCVTWTCLTIITAIICRSIIEIVKKLVDKKKEKIKNDR